MISRGAGDIDKGSRKGREWSGKGQGTVEGGIACPRGPWERPLVKDTRFNIPCRRDLTRRWAVGPANYYDDYKSAGAELEIKFREWPHGRPYKGPYGTL